MDSAVCAVEECADFNRLADRHDRRRGEGIPTLSTLVGTVPLAQGLWRMWAARHSRRTAVVTGGTIEDWFREWVHSVLSGRDLYLDAERYLRQRLPEPLDASHDYLRNKTQHELGLAFEHAGLDEHGVGADRICRWLLLRRSGGRSLKADDLIRTQMTWTADSSGAIDALSQLLGLIPPAAVPALLVVFDSASRPRPHGDDPSPPIELLQESARQLANLVTSAPRLSLAVAVSEADWQAYVERAPESFAKAVVREHIIHVRGWTAERMRQAVAARTSRPIDVPEQVFSEVARLGASPALVDSLCAALIADPSGHRGQIEESGEDNASEVCSESSRDARDPWKSAQEQFLFQLLEHTADLAGRFQLNAEPGFPFGNQPAAVDLLNSQLKIAVEVDGYFHFTSPDRYRRDRRKDYALQQHGFLVLRFLAEDVVPRMQTVLQAIREAVHLRESHRSS
jgi:very-short-patch-repair endonuclease